MPMLSRSNNVTEAFFSVLKYHILDGKSVTTFTKFLNIWAIYEVRLYSNVVRSGALEHMDGILERKMDSECDLFAFEDAEALVNEDELTNSQSGTQLDESEDERDIDIAQLQAQRTASRRSSLRLQLIQLGEELPSQIQTVLAQDPEPSVGELQSMVRSLENAASVLLASYGFQHMDRNVLAFTSTSNAFIRQANNYGQIEFNYNPRHIIAQESPPLNVTPVSSNSQMIPQGLSQSMPGPIRETSVQSTPPNIGSQLIQSMPQSLETTQSASTTFNSTIPVPSDVVATSEALVAARDNALSTDVIDTTVLGKKKKTNARAMTQAAATSPTWIGKQSFAEFAAELLSDTVSGQAIAKAKVEAKNAGLPLLRAALSNNCAARIRGLMYEFFGATFPKTINKTELVSRALQTLLGLGTIPPRSRRIRS